MGPQPQGRDQVPDHGDDGTPPGGGARTGSAHSRAGTGRNHSGHNHGAHDHSHGPATVTGGYRRVLTIVLLISLGIAAAEVAGAVITGALVLFADAAHMAADAAGIGLSLLAAWFASRPATGRRTFGYASRSALVPCLPTPARWRSCGTGRPTASTCAAPSWRSPPTRSGQPP